jgi:hypothetical protein
LGLRPKTPSKQKQNTRTHDNDRQHGLHKHCRHDR